MESPAPEGPVGRPPLRCAPPLGALRGHGLRCFSVAGEACGLVVAKGLVHAPAEGESAVTDEVVVGQRLPQRLQDARLGAMNAAGVLARVEPLDALDPHPLIRTFDTTSLPHRPIWGSPGRWTTVRTILIALPPSLCFLVV